MQALGLAVVVIGLRMTLEAHHALLAIACLIVLFPIYWMIITSLKLPREIYRVPSLWPKVFTLDCAPAMRTNAASVRPTADRRRG